jgi:hypothetical protein
VVAAAATTTTGNGPRRMASRPPTSTTGQHQADQREQDRHARWQQQAEADHDGRAEQNGVAGAAVDQRGLAQHHEPYVIIQPLIGRCGC